MIDIIERVKALTPEERLALAVTIASFGALAQAFRSVELGEADA